MTDQKNGKDQAKDTAEKIRAEVKEKKEELALTSKEITALFKGSSNVGTKEVSQEDLNTPGLKIVQELTKLDKGVEKKIGYFLRTDDNSQIKEPIVNIVCFKKVWALNFNKTADERKHVYFGVHGDSTEAFRMFLRGWSLTGSRKFLTEVKRLQIKHNIPMYALKIKLSTVEESGTMKNTGQSYTTSAIRFSILKDKSGMPVVETDLGKATFLKEMAEKFEVMNIEPKEEETPQPVDDGEPR